MKLLEATQDSGAVPDASTKGTQENGTVGLDKRNSGCNLNFHKTGGHCSGTGREDFRRFLCVSDGGEIGSTDRRRAMEMSRASWVNARTK